MASQGSPHPQDRPDECPEPVSQQVGDRVRQYRKQKGWTLEQLAALSRVSRSMLSQIERGTANPTLGVASRIAQALGTSLSDLVEEQAAQANIEIVRHTDTSSLFRDDQNCRIRTLSPLHLEKDVELYELVLHAGRALDSAPHYQGTREFLTVASGMVRVTSGADTCELRRGDSAHYAADVPHRIENGGRGQAVLFLVVIYP